MFTPAERSECERQPKLIAQRYAARFAAKEAVLKALGARTRWGFAWPLRALMLSMSAQERLTVERCQAHLGDRYLRVNQVPTASQRPLGDLDVADASMTGALLAYADAAVEDLIVERRTALDEFLR